MSGHRQRAFLALSALLVTFLTGGHAAAGDAHEQSQLIERLAPRDRQAYLQRLVARQHAKRGATLGADATGPVLTAFNASTTLNVSKSSAPFKVFVKATDDLSGVSYLYFDATGPSGQTITAYAAPGYPAKAVSLSGGFQNLNRMLEPGTWKFTYAYGYDAAGNYSAVDEATLDALGNTTFTVGNNTGHDIVKPLLTSGKVMTPAVSLSALVPGSADSPVYVGVKVTASDAGTTALAGVASVSLYFCKLAEPNVCIYPYGDVFATALSTASLTVGAQVSAANGIVTGTYELKVAYVYDHAGNDTYLHSTNFGGTTDFSALFPGGTTITLVP